MSSKKRRCCSVRARNSISAHASSLCGVCWNITSLEPPAFDTLSAFPLTVNDEGATRRVTDALKGRLGGDRVQPADRASASEDFTVLARAWNVPSVFWLVGGIDPKTYADAERSGNLNEIPSNHSPEFAPVIEPTLRAGIETMLAAAGAWLTPAGTK